MNESFYNRCKKVVAELDLSYEQGIARDVILNELDMLEKQAQDYQKRFNKAKEYLLDKYVTGKLGDEEVNNVVKILKGSNNND